MTHLRDFEQLWSRTNYSHSMAELGTLYDDVSIAQIDGTSDSEIRNWVTQFSPTSFARKMIKS